MIAPSGRRFLSIACGFSTRSVITASTRFSATRNPGSKRRGANLYPAGFMMADIVLINPRFEISFWGLEQALPFMFKRAAMPVAALPLLAALTPPEHSVTVIDENIEPIDFDRCARADVVGLTGMIVQRDRMREILVELRKRNAYIAVGGPWITVDEDFFSGLVDVAFIGEADETWPRFLLDWQSGTVAPRYEQPDKTDMTTLPPPRLDLLKMQHYAFGSLQISRGCPFQCEFCDIIVVFGRRPRLKTADQVVAELDQLRGYKVPTVFIVDDNLIGNKKAIKPLLRRIVDWQNENGYPFTIFTEASIDLADDPELMELMAQANVGALFVGIESPNDASLRETRKLQNVRAGGTMLEKIRRIQDAGIEVTAGMIVGFDSDDSTIFAAQNEFLEAARIPLVMLGMLVAIPKTPLFARLASANRLDEGHNQAYGTNIVPLQMSGEELRDGYIWLMARLYDPAAYFGRLDALYLEGRLQIDRGWHEFARRHPWRCLLRQARMSVEAVALMVMLAFGVSDRALRAEYRRRCFHAFRTRRTPHVLRSYALRCAMHYHAHQLVNVLQSRNRAVVNSF
jgi:radical SAM superfamily enzyme YgiQ (UPF0313 family)